MRKTSLVLVALVLAVVVPAAAQEGYQPSPENLEARAWFQEARFGLFIHWGPYSVAGVEASWPIMVPDLVESLLRKLGHEMDPRGPGGGGVGGPRRRGRRPARAVRSFPNG